MNENNNMTPFIPEDESKNDDLFTEAFDPLFNHSTEENEEPQSLPQDYEPLKEIPSEEFPEEAEPFLTEASLPEDPLFFPKPENPSIPPIEEPVNQEFNPYAPKKDENSFTHQTYNGNMAQNYSSQVNPSYSQPVNQNYQNNNFGNENPSGYPYNNFNAYPQPPAPKDNKNGKLIAVAIIAVCVIVAAIALVSSLLGGKDNNTLSTYPSTNTPASTQATTGQNVVVTPTQPINENINSIWVAEKVRPVVVGVLAYQQGELAGEGSGVLMSEDLTKNCTYVVTCAHVIDEPGCEFSILLLDGSLYDAEVVALDARTDIGVLKINKTGMNLAEFGDSSSLKIGEPIYAIGNPGGSEYFGSITNGIVSAIDRSISATYTMTCIQHNAAINPGNSGGALVNSAGQIIGINSSKIAKTDYEGMGFAVPSAIFKPVVEALIEYGYVPNRPELGIKYASVSDYQLYSIIVSIKGLPRESIIIAEIPEGSALSGTQAQVGDLIIAVNGIKMDSTNVLLDMIDTGAVGDTLTLTLCRVQNRSYETTTFDVTVQLVEDKGSITTTTQAATLPQQNSPYSDFGGFFDFFGW